MLYQGEWVTLMIWLVKIYCLHALAKYEYKKYMKILGDFLEERCIVFTEILGETILYQ